MEEKTSLHFEVVIPGNMPQFRPVIYISMFIFLVSMVIRTMILKFVLMWS
jgi:hypothetical protein